MDSGFIVSRSIYQEIVMQKHKFLLKSYSKHPKNYGLLQHPDWELLAWEKMHEKLDSHTKYLNHFNEN